MPQYFFRLLQVALVCVFANCPVGLKIPLFLRKNPIFLWQPLPIFAPIIFSCYHENLFETLFFSADSYSFGNRL